MELLDQELLQNDDILSQINFDIFEEFDFSDLPIPSNNEVSSVDENLSPSFTEIEQYLMKDDDHEWVEEEGRRNQEEDYFSDLLLDVPFDQFVESRVSNKDCSNPESNVSNDDCIEKESDNCDELKDGDNNDDQISKKRKRQMRNRDAALRSRERKKLYVKDLEIKSRYLESECKRLQHLVQCYAAENQSLHHHLQLQKNKASNGSLNKQESAVLLLESLLLGSLLWLMGIICLFSLPELLLHHPNPPASVLVSVGSDNLVKVVALRAKNRRIGFGRLWMFFRRKRWKATRLKSKEVFVSLADAVNHAVLV